MNIQWTTTNALGESVTENHPVINTENAHTYAKNTCHSCWSKGYNFYDNGYQYVQKQDENGFVYADREHLNPRAMLCDCAIRTIQRTGL